MQESQVNLYGTTFPTTFYRARGTEVWDGNQKRYLDFWTGAGALNYGHNNPYILEPVLSYIQQSGIVHALDCKTAAKEALLNELDIAAPGYRVQFCGPTGANSVEAAIKLARKATGRQRIVAFSGSYHGLSLGALSVTSDRRKGGGLGEVTFVPYSDAGLDYLTNLCADPLSGYDLPAAVIFEPIQAEGGVNVPPDGFVERLGDICGQYNLLCIADEIQTGCGRCGKFFVTEDADMVCCSKSLSGFGAPMSVVFIKPKWDVWESGEHTGTFRGFQLGYVGATAALKLRQKLDLERKTFQNYQTVLDWSIKNKVQIRGAGLLIGIPHNGAKAVQRRCFDSGLLVEAVGRRSNVIKLLPPLTITLAELEEGLEVLRGCL